MRCKTCVGAIVLSLWGCSDPLGSIDPSVTSTDTGQTTVSADADGVARFVAQMRPLGTGAALGAAKDPGEYLLELAPRFHANPAELVLDRAQDDELGDVHYRYHQIKDGHEVIGGELILHTRGGALYAANGAVRDDRVATFREPVLTAGEAVSAAAAAYADLDQQTIEPDPSLAYWPEDNTLRLVFRVNVRGSRAGEPVFDTVLVDAAGGAIAARLPQILPAKNREVHDSQSTSTLPGAVVARTERGSASPDAVVNTHFDLLGKTYDCYKSLFNLDSYNGAGAKLVSSVHFGYHMNNAFWDTPTRSLAFGDGDGTNASQFATALDVVAHEFTHGVTTYASHLVYSGESGGLNESMSDIFGAVCEWFTNGQGLPSPNVWLCGEDVATPNVPGDAIRYMADPEKDGVSLDYYPDYTGSSDPHETSGISNLAFELFSEGGTHPRGKTTISTPGVGIDIAAQVFYRASSTLFYPLTSFGDARTATEVAATQLNFGSTVVPALDAAWAAVGVTASTASTVGLEAWSGRTFQSLAFHKAQGSSPTGIVASGMNGDARSSFKFLPTSGGPDDTTYSGDGVLDMSGLSGNTLYAYARVREAGPGYVFAGSQDIPGDCGSSSTAPIVGVTQAGSVVFDNAFAVTGQGMQVLDAAAMGSNFVVAGSACTTSSSHSAMVSRFTSSGALDASFGNGGVAVGPSGSSGIAVTVTASNQVLVAGRDQSGNMLLWRLDSTGHSSTTQTLSLPSASNRLDTISSISVASDGMYLITGGYGVDVYQTQGMQFVLKVDPTTLAPVTGFGSGGFVVRASAAPYARAWFSGATQYGSYLVMTGVNDPGHMTCLSVHYDTGAQHHHGSIALSSNGDPLTNYGSVGWTVGNQVAGGGYLWNPVNLNGYGAVASFDMNCVPHDW